MELYSVHVRGLSNHIKYNLILGPVWAKAYRRKLLQDCFSQWSSVLCCVSQTGGAESASSSLLMAAVTPLLMSKLHQDYVLSLSSKLRNSSLRPKPITWTAFQSRWTIWHFKSGYSVGRGASPTAQQVENPPADVGQTGDAGSVPQLGRSSGQGNGKSHGQRSLVGYSPWGHKELDLTKRLSMHSIRNLKDISTIT